MTPKEFIASRIVSASSADKDRKPTSEDLAAAISEITVETQTAGASTLTLALIDPGCALAKMGWLAVDDDGILDEIECEFPENSEFRWRLCAVDLSTDANGPNLTLTFEDRIVALLRDQWGSKTARPGTTTRAQFIKSLADEVSGVTFICPEINALQPVEGLARGVNSESLTTATTRRQTANQRKANKAAGLGTGAGLRVGGLRMTQTQVDNANLLLGVASDLNVGSVATTAIIYAAIGESKMGLALDVNSKGYGSLLGASSTIWAGHMDDFKAMARSFFLGGRGFQPSPSDGQHGGALYWTQVRGVTNPAEVAIRTEVPSDWPHDSYAGQVGGSEYMDEARAIVSAGGAGTGGATSITTKTVKSDVSQLTRGTNDDPYEGSWECMSRLAEEVNWALFSNGNYLYYMNGPQLVKQAPAAYVDMTSLRGKVTQTNGARSGDDVVYEGVVSSLTGTFDNTAFDYTGVNAQSRKRVRKRIGRPQTPTEIQLTMICGEDDYRAGDVFVIQHFGPLSGRWIVTDATRNTIGDIFTTFTLGPPTAPLPEPSVTTTRTRTSPIRGLTLTTGDKAKINDDGTASAPASAPDEVKAVIAAGNDIHRKPYLWGGGHGSFQDAGYDCSGSVSYALHGGGLLDTPLSSYTGGPGGRGLQSWGQPGPGRWITVYASSDHAWMEVAGIYFDTSSTGSAGVPTGNGPRWRSRPDGNTGPGYEFVPRHPPGL